MLLDLNPTCDLWRIWLQWPILWDLNVTHIHQMIQVQLKSLNHAKRSLGHKCVFQRAARLQVRASEQQQDKKPTLPDKPPSKDKTQSKLDVVLEVCSCRCDLWYTCPQATGFNTICSCVMRKNCFNDRISKLQGRIQVKRKTCSKHGTRQGSKMLTSSGNF
jgi:hypothetical protein